MNRRLVHINPRLNDKVLWYRLVGDLPAHYLVIIVGPQGVINSATHAVPKDDYTVESEPKGKGVAPAPDANEFI